VLRKNAIWHIATAQHIGLWHDPTVLDLIQVICRMLADVVGMVALSLRPRRSIQAENLLLRRQLALFKERGLKPRRIDAATRLSFACLSQRCDWRSCLIVVRPETVIRWHRAGWRLFWVRRETGNE
jgi:putative transposase